MRRERMSHVCTCQTRTVEASLRVAHHRRTGCKTVAAAESRKSAAPRLARDRASSHRDRPAEGACRARHPLQDHVAPVADTCRSERARLSRHLAQYPLSPATTGERQGEGVCPPARHRAPRRVGEMTLTINTCRAEALPPPDALPRCRRGEGNLI